jgi:GntR family transcriptional repressor for pyruvate dehydrogenase complex
LSDNIETDYHERMAAVSIVLPPGNPQSLRRRGRSLAHELVDGLGGQIRAQALRPGDKLPTESEIMRAWGVSRTVVREALSRLQAAGLVETRHGIGTFVLQPPASGFGLEPSELPTAGDVLAVLELRISLETEAAGLAAQRRSEQQLADIRAALDELEANREGEGDTVTPDMRFHMLIATATGNRYFAEIMGHLGTTLIPRARINSPRVAHEDLPQYLRRVNAEHEEIYEAIARRDPEAARAAMRLHLTNSRERLRRAQEATQAAASA